MAAVVSAPRYSGRRTSIMLRLGWCWRQAANAASQLAASATTSMSGSTLRDADRPMRTMKWSSTTKMRMGFKLGIGSDGGLQHDLDGNAGAMAGSAINYELRS